jgi:ribonuclease D
MTLITTTDDLAAFCARVRGEPYLTIDTEFMRDRTYYPKLCLVQVGAAAEAVAIDPLAPGIELGPLSALLADPSVLKVMHAARQDLEIFWRQDGRLPAPLFDTQIAAMVCGYGEEVGYETLATRIARARIDKSSRFADWAARPLREAQLRYALDDVIHLRAIYEALAAELERTGRRGWLDDEHAQLLDPRLYETRPEDAWKRLKMRSREPRFVATVQRLAAWREREAQMRDVPRARVLRDEILLELAAARPRDLDALRALPRLSLDRASAQAVVETIREAMALPQDALPRLDPPRSLPAHVGPLVDVLRMLLKLRCEAERVAPKMIAGTADLEAIAQDDDADVPALRGWRREVFGEAALAMKHGRLAVTVRDRKVVLVEAGAAL